MTITNYHSHTFRCKHAAGDAVDYVREVHSKGVSVYGISDHAPVPDGRFPHVRMDLDELNDYEHAVQKAQAMFPDIVVLLGLECEYFPEFHAFYEEELLGKREYDYLFGAGHYTPLHGEWWNSFMRINTTDLLAAYSRYLAEMMETGLFEFIAHPDIFGCCNETWNKDLTACSRDILSAAEETGTPLEINGYGMRKPPMRTAVGTRHQYPWLPFWELAAEYNITVVCNSDAHHPEHALANLGACRKLARRFRLKQADLSHLHGGLAQPMPDVA